MAENNMKPAHTALRSYEARRLTLEADTLDALQDVKGRPVLKMRLEPASKQKTPRGWEPAG